MIESMMVKCKDCGTIDHFYNHKKTPAVDTIVQRAGWRKTIRGWLCPSCRMDEPKERK